MANDFEQLKMKYISVIEKVISENKFFYLFNHQIPWRFYWDDNAAIVAHINKAVLGIEINLKSVYIAYEEANQPLAIEWYILHEIRHIYQHLRVREYEQGSSAGEEDQYAKLCQESFDSYIQPQDEAGKPNPDYYYNYVEFDAFSYSYAIMLFKYGHVDYITPPQYYGEDFYRVVNERLKTFIKRYNESV